MGVHAHAGSFVVLRDDGPLVGPGHLDRVLAGVRVEVLYIVAIHLDAGQTATWVAGGRGDVDDRDYMLDEVSEIPRGNDVDGVPVGHALGLRRGDDGHLSCFGLVGEYAAIRDGVLSLSTVTYLPSASTYPCACRSASCSYSVCVPP